MFVGRLSEFTGFKFANKTNKTKDINNNLCKDDNQAAFDNSIGEEQSQHPAKDIYVQTVSTCVPKMKCVQCYKLKIVVRFVCTRMVWKCCKALNNVRQIFSITETVKYFF